MKNKFRILLISSTLLIFSSCLKNEICSSINIRLEAGIYNKDSNNLITGLVATKIDVDTIYAISMENNHLLLNAKQIDKIKFPLNNDTNESSFVLSFGNIKDTLHIFYDKQLYFNSIKCGVYYNYTITKIDFSTNLLQEVILTKPEINVVSAQNIQLVF